MSPGPHVSFTQIDWTTEERFTSLRKPLGVEAFGLNQLVLQPGQRGRIHRHREQEEVYLVLRGELTLLVEAQEHRVGEGELARVVPSARRQLANLSRKPCVLVAIGGAGDHVGRDGEAFAGWDDDEPHTPQEIPLPGDVEIR
jgi:uncharacterized cupin superfamily protein